MGRKEKVGVEPSGVGAPAAAHDDDEHAGETGHHRSKDEDEVGNLWMSYLVFQVDPLDVESGLLKGRLHYKMWLWLWLWLTTTSNHSYDFFFFFSFHSHLSLCESLWMWLI